MITAHIRLAVIALIFTVATIASAQSPRKVLMEEFTNASSPSAATQDSIFHLDYLAGSVLLDRVVPIGYHTNFPGVDSLNILAPVPNNSRAGYYGVTEVPILRVNGRRPAQGIPYAGAPADTGAISAAIAAAPAMSPITITMAQQSLGLSVKGTVNVSSVAPIAGARLYIIAMRFTETAWLNGRHALPYYYHVPQRMFPDASGTPLALAAGESKTVQISYPTDDVGLIETYFVAFVQDTTTMEVLQAQSSIIAPSILANRPSPVLQGQDAPVTWNAELHSTVSQRYQVYPIVGLPDGWSYRLMVDGKQIETDDSVDLAPGMAVPMSVEITPSATSSNRRASVVVILLGRYGFSTSMNFTLYSGPIETIGLYRDANWVSVRSTIDETLDALPGSYASLRLGDERYFDLSAHILLYSTGKQGMPASDIPLLGDALRRGGRILFTGAELAYALGDPANADTTAPRDTAFLHGSLHTDYVADKSASFIVAGESGDPIGAGLHFDISTGVATQDAPDVIAPRAGAESAFYYGEGKGEVAGIRYADAINRIVVLGFGIEGIGDAGARHAVLGRSIEWLRGESGVASSMADAHALLGTPWPNPASRVISARISARGADPVRVGLFDARGALVAETMTRAFGTTGGLVQFDCSALPAGAYRIVARSGGEIRTALVSVVH